MWPVLAMAACGTSAAPPSPAAAPVATPAVIAPVDAAAPAEAGSGSGSDFGSVADIMGSDIHISSSSHGDSFKPENTAVHLGRLAVTGKLDKVIVRRFVHRQMARLDACYLDVLESHAGLAGTVTLRFTITGDGKVSTSTASGVDDALSTCMAAVVATVEFPKPTDRNPVTVVYPVAAAPP
jgi:hypothetical protein